LLVIPWGSTRQPLPIRRSILWRIQFARDATWLLYAGGLVTGVLLGIVSDRACGSGGLGLLVGLLACLTAYVPATAFLLMMPTARLRTERRTRQQDLELKGIHPRFAAAVNDRLLAAGLVPANFAAVNPSPPTPVSPVPRTRPVVAATILTVALISVLTLLVVVATGGSGLACHQNAGR
jgi:hypothetical protein